MQFRRKRGWEISESELSSESAYRSRRSFLKGLGVAGLGLAAAGRFVPDLAIGGPQEDALQATIDATRRYPTSDLYPAPRNASYAIERELSDELVAAAYNNYYEFTTDKAKVWELARSFDPWPWTLEVGGHVEKKGRHDLDALCREIGLEERVYRFRCVEAWAMTVPWTGFPLRKLIDRLQPSSKARFVRFLSFERPSQAIGQKTQDWYAWPYYEGLRMDEAMNELAFVATGIFGHPLPVQHGSPLRIIVPWKYGYKSPKGVVRMEFTDEQPKTFWNDLTPREYPFLSNVNPNVPHPRWSQARERLIGPQNVVETRLFNGYGDWVAPLYPNEPRG